MNSKMKFMTTNYILWLDLIKFIIVLWIAVNLQQYKCKYRKPRFNF